MKISGTKPRARHVHAACCIAGPLTGQEHPLLMVVGGTANDILGFNDVWLLDVDEGVWSEVGMLTVIVYKIIIATCKHTDRYLYQFCVLFNPRCACAARVTPVCVSVCLCVCLSRRGNL